MVGGERQPKTEKGKAGTLLSTSSTSLSSSADDVALLSYQPHSSCAFNSAHPPSPPLSPVPGADRLSADFMLPSFDSFDAKLLHFDPPNGQKLNLVAFTGLKRGRSGGAGPPSHPSLCQSIQWGLQRPDLLRKRIAVSCQNILRSTKFIFFSPPTTLQTSSLSAALSVPQSRFKEKFF